MFSSYETIEEYQRLGKKAINQNSFAAKYEV